MHQKIVICGAGFLGSNVAKAMISNSPHINRLVQISSRHPEKEHESIRKSLNESQVHRLGQAVPADITKPDTLKAAFEGADVVVSLVGTLYGTPADFERIQWKGAENVARAAQASQAKLVHISAIGANISSSIPYARTKALGEQAVFEACPTATIIRPSIVFGPGDGFFGRFAKLSKVLPIMPVFGGGKSLFQPVYVGDIARAIEAISQNESPLREQVSGKVIEAGGPEVLTYREVMELVLKCTGRWRPIVSLPFAVGYMQGFVLEKLPPNLFTLTRGQVEQLKQDNIVSQSPPPNHYSFKELLEKHTSSKLTSVHDVLPTYLNQM